MSYIRDETIDSKEPKLIVDFSQIFYGHYYVQKSIGKTITTNSLCDLIYKTISKVILNNREHLKLKGLITRHKFVLVFDDLNFRKDIYDDYKATRLVSEEVSYYKHSCFEYYRDITGFNMVKIKGFEADDIIALIANPGDIILSNDGDLFQIPDIYLLSPRDKKNILVKTNHSIATRVFNVIEGCSTDNVAKIVQRFDKKLKEYIIENVEDDGFLLEFFYYYPNISEELYYRNYELIIFNYYTYLKYQHLLCQESTSIEYYLKLLNRSQPYLMRNDYK